MIALLPIGESSEVELASTRDWRAADGFVREVSMAASKHARDILFFDVIVDRRTSQAPWPPLSALVALWTTAHANPKFPAKEFEKGSITSIIKDVSIVPDDVATLLIEVSDKNAPNQTYLDHQAKTARHLPKTRPEGNGHSAHIVLSLKQQKGQPNTYLALIEAIPGVSIAKIQSTLNTAIRLLCKADDSLFTFVKAGGIKQKPKSYVPHITLGGHPSKQFLSDLETGKVSGLKLIAPQGKQVLGQSPFLHVNNYSLDVSVSKDIPKGQRWKTLFTDITSKNADFPMARIYVQPEEGGKSFHVDVDTATGKVIGEAYIRSRRIAGITPMLENSSADAIVTHFADLMSTILLKERTV